MIISTSAAALPASKSWTQLAPEHLAADVARSPELSVNVAVEVACWCARDHNIHYVRESARPVADTAEVVEAFAAGVAMLTSVLNSGPFDPRPWRLDAGLPDAPPETR
jgi:hypothetical protein